MRSIKTKLLIFFSVLLGVTCIGLGFLSFYNAKRALRSNIRMTLPKIVEETANNIQGRIKI